MERLRDSENSEIEGGEGGYDDRFSMIQTRSTLPSSTEPYRSVYLDVQAKLEGGRRREGV